MRGDWYQITLILLGMLVTALLGVFFYRELFPEYRLYQNDYIALETFRSTYTGQSPPPFKKGIKQILIPDEERGPPIIDRCTSCHVALQLSHFSPTKIATDINGNIIYNDDGLPKQVPNENDVWNKLDQKIADLKEKGEDSQAKKLEALKTAQVGDHVYDVTKVLKMHPLIGRETRPFEYHPIDEYGCTSCHSGNGRGLTTEKAHGPVFDEFYEPQFMGPKKEFLEEDVNNDPRFSTMFNDMPGHELAFQTTPIYVGALIQSKCMQCHQSSQGVLQEALRQTEVVTARRRKQIDVLQAAFFNEKKALLSLLQLKRDIETMGYEKTVEEVRRKSQDLFLPEKERDAVNVQLSFLLKNGGERQALTLINRDIDSMIGQKEIVQKLVETDSEQNRENDLQRFIEAMIGKSGATGTVFAKKAALDREEDVLFHIRDAETSLRSKTVNENILAAIPSEIDQLTKNFHRGENLFISQACYACHRIDGLFRGGVGPDLTEIGKFYPWYIKESIVWPQADLPTSTMPNYKLDHEELEDLVTYLLAQMGRGKSISEASYRTALLEWEAGKKSLLEKPVNPGKLNDVDYGMTIFATEGCAACHRLRGFSSNVGYRVEKEQGKNLDFETLYREQEWFTHLFPETISGSEIVAAIDKHADEIDKRIADNVRENSILEKLEEEEPQLIESFYSPFKFAMRAKNHTEDFSKKKEWKKRVRRILMMYVQEYGLGRLIGPRPNWSGIYRSDEWLIEHFRKPSRHTARSIMPVMPFDDSKFYALTHMLDVLAIKNRDDIRQVWRHFGFNPEHAYQTLCSQCHGAYLHGNGPVSEWIYPIPKNLRNADFLRNLTRENVIQSIMQGVKGTPMPPWGEVMKNKPFPGDESPVLTKHEITQLVDWLFSSLLGGTVIRSEEDVQKWRYQPEDILREMQKEGDVLKPGPLPEFLDLKETKPQKNPISQNISNPVYLAALTPVINQASNAPQENGVKEVFDVYANPQPGPEEKLYYIQEKYYTEENIQRGHEFFELNCAVCHGKEADGMGFRAGSMYDAKPRMFTNLYWMETHDDLRMLRSIKYGVPGTAMTPWGDQTSSLQRLQLVIFIRSLNLEQEERDELFKNIYQLFHQTDQVIDVARIEENQRANELADQMKETRTQLAKVSEQIEKGARKKEEAADLFLKELSLSRKLQQHKEADALLVKIKEAVKEEGKIYQSLGIILINKTIMGDIFEKYLQIFGINNRQYQVKNGKLEAHFSEEKERRIDEIGKKLVKEIENQIQIVNNTKTIVEGQLRSAERNEELNSLNNVIRLLTNVKTSLISDLKEAYRLRQQQETLFHDYQKKLEAFQHNDTI